jgi:hypothetical protein
MDGEGVADDLRVIKETVADLVQRVNNAGHFEGRERVIDGLSGINTRLLILEGRLRN